MQTRLNEQKVDAALQDDLADELNDGGTIVDIDELASRVILDKLVYSQQFSNTTVEIIIFDSNFANATFTVAEAVAALEAVFANPDSRMRSKGFVEADSIESISGASVPKADLVLCADGIKRESCPSGDNDKDLAFGVAMASCVVVVIVLLGICRYLVLPGCCGQRNKVPPAQSRDDDSNSDTEDGTTPDNTPAVGLHAFDVSPGMAKIHPEA
jgi:hypothetical protein